VNKYLDAAMRRSWAEYHGCCESNNHLNTEYEVGFNAAVQMLVPLLQQAAPHVYASHNAEHMLDGFKPQPRKIDSLVWLLREVLDGEV
jgi:hypothetical protein